MNDSNLRSDGWSDSKSTWSPLVRLMHMEAETACRAIAILYYVTFSKPLEHKYPRRVHALTRWGELKDAKQPTSQYASSCPTTNWAYLLTRLDCGRGRKLRCILAARGI